MPDTPPPDSAPSSNWPTEGSGPQPASAGSAGGESAEDLFNRGLDHHDRGELDLAIACYKRAVEIDPQFVVAHNNLGMVYIEAGSAASDERRDSYWLEAVAALERTIELDPTYAEAYNNLGFVNRRLGHERNAAAYYAEYLKIQPDVEDGEKIGGWLDSVRGRLGLIPAIGPDGKVQGPASDEPPSDGAASEEVFPDSEARTLVMPPGSPLAAAARREAPPVQPLAAAPGPSAPAAAAPGGSWLDEEGGSPAAGVKGAPAGAAAGPPAAETPEALCEKGIAEFEAGELAPAEANLRRAVAADPGMAVARSALGRVLAKAGRHEEAADELKLAVGLDQTDAAAYYVLGFTLRKLGRDTEAADAYERFLELTPDAGEGPQIREWIADVREAPSAAPGELYTSALTSFQGGKLTEALTSVEDALAADESDVAANVLMGRILVQKGDYIRAVPVLKRAERLKPHNPEVHFYLGQAYEKRGLSDDAVAAYQKCLDVAPDGPQAEAVRAWLDKARTSEAAKTRARCDYCFRPFTVDQLSPHDGKKICPDCMANLGSTAAPKAAAVALPHAVVERAAAAEAARARRKVTSARIRHRVLTVALSVILAFGILLLFLRYGLLEGTFRKIGVHSALRGMGLQKAFRFLGIDLSPRRIGPLPPDRGDDGTGGGPDRGTVEVPAPPEAEPLVLGGPANVLALPLADVSIPLERKGGAGEVKYALVAGPDGMKVDPATGRITWKALADFQAKVEGGKPLELPWRREVEVEAATADGEKATFRFGVQVHLAFGKGAVQETGAGPGDDLRLAVGRLNVAQGRSLEDIAVAWGGYREGYLRILYRQDTPGRFAALPPVSLEGRPAAISLADFTGDGRTDAVVANWYRSRLHVFRQDEAGRMVPEGTLPTARGAGELVAGDVDGDGLTDLVAAHWTKATLYCYRQRPVEAEGNTAGGRLGEPLDYLTNQPSGWNRLFVGPLRDSQGPGRRAVYLMCGSGDEPLFKIFPVLEDGRLDYYRTSSSAAGGAGGGGKLLPARPLDARLIRSGDGPPLIAALIGGEEPALYVIGAKGENLEIVARPRIALKPYPAGFTVADLNGDGGDDLAVLYPGELVVYLNARAAGAPAGGPYVALAPVAIPGAAGPLAAGEFTGDARPDIVVARDDGKLQIVEASVIAGEGAGEEVAP